jgi:hypothetical protein
MVAGILGSLSWQLECIAPSMWVRVQQYGGCNCRGKLLNVWNMCIKVKGGWHHILASRHKIFVTPLIKNAPKCSSSYKLFRVKSYELFCARVVCPFMVCHAQRGRSKIFNSFCSRICSFTIEEILPFKTMMMVGSPWPTNTLPLSWFWTVKFPQW